MNEHTRNTLKNITSNCRRTGLSPLSADAPGIMSAADIVLVENQSGFAISRGMCVAFEEPAILPQDSLNEFLARPMFKAVWPYRLSTSHPQRLESPCFGVAVEPIPRNAMGRVCVSGVCPAVIYLPDGEASRDDTFCDIAMRDRWYATLESALAGCVRILYLSEEPYRMDEKPENNPVADTYWGIVRLGVDAPIQLEVEMQEPLRGKPGLRAKAEVLRSRRNGNARDWMNAEQWNEEYPPENTEDDGKQPRVIDVERPAWMRPTEELWQGLRLSVQWYPRERAWFPIMPRLADFYGIPPQSNDSSNSPGYPPGSVFEATGKWAPPGPYDSNIFDSQRHVLQLYVAGTSSAWSYQPEASLWVTQEYIPAGSTDRVIIKKIDDPTSVSVRTVESVSDPTVKFSQSYGTRYSLNDGDTAMTAYDGTRPVWICQENGRLHYERYGVYECRVTELVSRTPDGRQTVKVTTSDAGQEFKDLLVRTHDVNYGGVWPDIYVGDMVTAQIDFEKTKLTYSGIVLTCPMDEKRGSVRVSTVTPGRGWVNIDSEIFTSTATNAYLLRGPFGGVPYGNGSGTIAAPARTIGFWRKKYPEDN